MNQHSELRQLLRQQAQQKKTKPVKSPERTLVVVQIALALLPLLTACIYLFGMTRHMGYLDFFNVDSSEFPLSTEQNLLMGVLSLVSNVLPLIFYPTAVVIGLMVLGTVAALTFRLIKKGTEQVSNYGARIGSSGPMTRFYKKAFKYAIEPHESKWLEAMFDVIFTWYYRFIYVFTACAIVFGLAFVSYRDGGEYANKQITKMGQGAQDFTEQLIYAKHPEGIPALRIACNATQCTFWTEEDGTIYLRHDQIDSVTIPPKPDSKEQSPREKAS
ncbi:hypothetical protein CF138_04655 [Aeromonas hydrophila]|jgi:hypothetical protein|uniref:hypothetical protein n=1 Tax=Aeromonas hydrophila TaxID=644 RepID=UPI00111738DE|nr:hypothetical protein [Aeromonas hydrophila]TNH89153.1 hypothetical protein CF138_04655 [Aeromonas hydrophila]TNI00949.1 hypothetical protein CF136_08660 [Aeromonas hydrophila]TNI97998.1 hypothetical protein CF118_06005 [Aeromonas hydrophila]